MFNELEDLMKIARRIEVEPVEAEIEEPEQRDISAYFYDSGMPTDAFGDTDEQFAVIKPASDIGGSASNLNPEKEPIFEKNASETGKDRLESKLFGGLGLHRQLTKVECGAGCPCPFNVCDRVRFKDCETPAILLVKNVDGNMVTLAKPTENVNEFSKGHDGCWPEFYASQYEIEPMEDAPLETEDDLNTIIRFNDANTNGIVGRTTDSTPMDVAQKVATANQLERVSDFLDEVFGTCSYKEIATGKAGNGRFELDCSPAVSVVSPDGGIESMKFGYFNVD